MGIALALALITAAVIAVIRIRSDHRPEVFDGITPGLFPAPDQVERRRKLGKGEVVPVAVQFTPPKGVSPGLAGTVIDNEVNSVDISATLIDLAVRGWLRLHRLNHNQIPASAEEKPKATKTDWELIRSQTPPSGDKLSNAEQVLVSELFDKSDSVTLSQLRATHGAVLRKAIVMMYAETLTRGWFPRHPRQRAKKWPALAVGLVVIGLIWIPLTIAFLDLPVAGIGLIVAGAILGFGTRGLTTPVTAAGYAIRVQALGFKQYLATAEADQLKFEAGADIYSRYLPYAMVFGVVAHWNQVFAEAIRDRDHLRWAPQDGDLGALTDLSWADLSWIDLTDFEILGHFGETEGFGALFDGDVVAGVTDALPGFADAADLDSATEGLGSIVEGLGHLTEGLGDFAASVGDLLGGLGDLTDGCGCDF